MADVDECTMAQACWASLTLALLEKDASAVRAVEVYVAHLLVLVLVLLLLLLTAAAATTTAA